MTFKDRFYYHLPFIRQILPPKVILFSLIFFMLIENGLSLVSPWLIGLFSESVLTNESQYSLNYRTILLLWVLVTAVQSYISYKSRVLAGVTSEKVTVTLRTRLYEHLQALPLDYFNDRRQGEILALLNQDTSIISNFLTTALVGTIPNLIIVTGALVCIFLISPLVALLCGVLIPTFVIVSKLLARDIRGISQKLMRQYGLTYSIATENFASISIIKSFTREPIEFKRFKNSNSKLFDLSTLYLQKQAKIAPAIRFFAVSIIFLILLFAGESIAKGSFSTAQLVSLVLYALLLSKPLSSLAEIYGQTQKTVASAERLFDLLSIEKEDYSSGDILPIINGQITLRNISFGYPGRGVLFSDLNLTISAGSTIAITGANGSGKSTIAHLLLKLYTPVSGDILLDGHNLENINLNSLRSQIGLVQQNVLLQNGTIFDNILFGNPSASFQQVEDAARIANGYDFIMMLPDGFNTIIGEQGVKLSGGQKQRVSLARALIKNPPILILDEATAMFDPQGEDTFLKFSRDIFDNHTVIIITHRPASLALADCIYELKDGSLTQLQQSHLQSH